MTTWTDVQTEIHRSKPRNVKLHSTPHYRVCLQGNDGTVLSTDPHIALGYVRSDWDAINCQATR